MPLWYTVTLLVSFHQCLCYKGFVAYVTAIWPTACMITFVDNKRRPLSKFLTTLVTRVGAFTCVRPQMDAKSTTGNKRLSAYVTDYWFLTSVAEMVWLKWGLTRKGLATYITQKSGVGLHVRPEQLSQSEITSASSTVKIRCVLLKRCMMIFNVGIQVSLTRVGPSTNVTFKWFISWVHYLMILQLIFGNETFTTHFTFEVIFTTMPLLMELQCKYCNSRISTNITYMIFSSFVHFLVSS